VYQITNMQRFDRPRTFAGFDFCAFGETNDDRRRVSCEVLLASVFLKDRG
jgi:hypothetical protein